MTRRRENAPFVKNLQLTFSVYNVNVNSWTLDAPKVRCFFRQQYFYRYLEMTLPQLGRGRSFSSLHKNVWKRVQFYYSYTWGEKTTGENKQGEMAVGETNKMSPVNPRGVALNYY